MTDSKGNKVGHHTHTCYACGTDFDPHWYQCQRCGIYAHLLKKENKKTQEIKQ